MNVFDLFAFYHPSTVLLSNIFFQVLQESSFALEFSTHTANKYLFLSFKMLKHYSQNVYSLNDGWNIFIGLHILVYNYLNTNTVELCHKKLLGYRSNLFVITGVITVMTVMTGVLYNQIVLCSKIGTVYFIPYNRVCYNRVSL